MDTVGEFIVFVAVMCLMLFGGCMGGYEAGYEHGQTDALSGAAIWYELTPQPNGERVWKELKEPTTRPAK